jgi:hypothetical protein
MTSVGKVYDDISSLKRLASSPAQLLGPANSAGRVMVHEKRRAESSKENCVFKEIWKVLFEK